MSNVLHGLGTAMRQLRRSPGFVIVVAVTLGLGVGANVIVFSLVSGVLMAPLPYPEADRIVSVSEDNPEIDMPVGFTSIPNFRDWRDQNTAFESMALFRGRSASVGTDALPEYAYSAYVTSEFFDVFGVQPLLGRSFSTEETAGGEQVAILGHGLWARGFGSDPDIVGRTARLDGNPYTIVGVMPAGFSAPGEWMGPEVEIQVWRPFDLSSDDQRGNRSYSVVARLGGDIDLTRAQAEMAVLDGDLRSAYPDANGAWQIQLITWPDLILGEFRPTLLLLLGTMLLVLVIACANVANLSVTRMLARGRELATRVAMGAGRGRILGQVLAESLLLSCGGAVVGLGLAYGGLSVLRAIEPGELPRLDAVTIDAPVLPFSLVLALASAVGFGTLSAWVASGSDPAQRLRAGKLGSRGSGWRLRATLATAQLVTSFALLAGAGLLGRSFHRLASTDLGFEPEGVTAATVALAWGRVTTYEERAAFTRDVLAELAALPGVESSGMINSLPLSGSSAQTQVSIEGVTEEGREPAVAVRGISPGYFETMGIRIRQGRDLRSDDLGGGGTVLVNDLMASMYWPDGDAVGRRLWLGGVDEPMSVVGVVDDVKHYGPARDVRPELYTPYSIEGLTSKTYVVRSSLESGAAAEALRAAIRRVDPEQPVREIRSMTECTAQITAGARFQAAMMAAAAALAMILACVGLFAAMSSLVGERTREIAIRMAMGARGDTVLRLVLGRAGTIVAFGIGGGVLLALAFGRVLESFLFGVAPRDPLVFGVVALGFVALSLLAAYLPARRAIIVDPATVLRQD